MAGLLPKRGSPVFLFRPLRQRLVWCGNFRGTMSSRAGSGNHWKKLENVQIFRLFLNSSWMLLPVREILFRKIKIVFVVFIKMTITPLGTEKGDTSIFFFKR